MRASRLLAILILLQNRGRQTAEALAEEFEVSERTIYRDIDALSAAGVPIYGDRGPGGGFALLDGYRTRLTGLADDEAAALALAGVPSAAAAVGFGAALRDAFGKLFAALPGEGGIRAGVAAARFHVDPVDWYRGTEPPKLLPELAQAVLTGRQVDLAYGGWKGSRDHRLDPLGLVLKAGEWYLIARGRRGIATYRVRAVRKLAVCDEGLDYPADFNLQDWWRAAQTKFEASLFTSTAILRASPLGRERLAQLSPRGAAAVTAMGAPDPVGWAEGTMAFEDSDHGARELLSLGAEVEVVAPDSLRSRVSALAREIVKLHG